MIRITEFWDKHKDTIKNVVILVSVPLAILAVYGVSELNKFMDTKGIKDEYYSDDEEA